jgi:hypothetical protein
MYMESRWDDNQKKSASHGVFLLKWVITRTPRGLGLTSAAQMVWMSSSVME